MKTARPSKILSAAGRRDLLTTLRERFERNPHRHPGLAWRDVATRLAEAPTRLWSLSEMERTGGEPDVVGRDRRTGEYLFMDCSPESPKGRTSLCYDRAALESRKEFRPKNSAEEMAAAMGIELLDEQQYRELQELGEFDTKSSSWVKSPPEIRNLGGALFGDRRFGRVFIYHNGAQSYYSGRGFRGWLRI